MSEYILPHVDGYLKLGQDYDCSDIHLAVNSRPTWRRFGQLLPIWEEAPNLTPQDTEVLARGFLEDPEWNRLQQRGDVDFAYANDFGRYRASVVKQRLGYDICFRIINTRVRTMEEIGLPTEYVVPLTRYTNGLILVTGSVGSGKSTTLASIVDFINQDRHDHIITLEDPIEYLIPSKNCHVNQREVHKHTESFARALRGALREDPDVIMVGEMRAHGGRNRPPGARHPAYGLRSPYGGPRAGRLPGGTTRPDPHHGQRIPARHHLSAAGSQSRRQRPRSGH